MCQVLLAQQTASAALQSLQTTQDCQRSGEQRCKTAPLYLTRQIFQASTLGIHPDEYSEPP